MRVDPGRKWRDVPPRDLYPQGMAFEQDVEHLYRQVRAQCPAEADGVLFTSEPVFVVSDFSTRCEQDLQRPVVSANQASLWHCLRLSGVNTPVKGYGKLLLI